KAGVIDYFFENRPDYLLIDEIDKTAPKKHTFLLNLMETGINSEKKFGKTRQKEKKKAVFSTCKNTRKLTAALRSRFFVVELKPYTYDQFYEITVHLLHDRVKVAPTIADAVWNKSKNLRDCVRIGKLAKSNEDVNFLVDKFIVPGGGAGN